MRGPARRLFFCWLVLLAVLAGGHRAQAQTGGVVVLHSQHKRAPAQGGVTPARHEQTLVMVHRQRLIKRRPAARNRRRWNINRLRQHLSARSAIVVDASTGRPLYTEAPDLPGQPASTIKVLTGLIAIDSLRNRDQIVASRRAARMPRSKIYLRPGRVYQANDLINAVLMASANDASVALAERVAGSERAFAKLMTRKARALGARKTVCRTASGLTVRGQQTTARDLALIFNRAMQNREFARRMSYRKVRTRFGKILWTHNRALWEIRGAEGGKTGYTRAARQTYVGKFRRGEDELVVAIMGSETMWNDIRTLVEYGFSVKRRLGRSLARNAGRRAGPVAVQRLRPATALTAFEPLRERSKVSAM